ncbi:hypothetical protein [Streptomyces sp. 5-10]|uniref:hypothetical protein n=1 Tax=Streptomyces sp. 5-10 TaxID=878925 RepID=UPI00168B847C|nr:hypothetical protein [Streptomyces sp. 5-10]
MTTLLALGPATTWIPMAALAMVNMLGIALRTPQWARESRRGGLTRPWTCTCPGAERSGGAEPTIDAAEYSQNLGIPEGGSGIARLAVTAAIRLPGSHHGGHIHPTY